MTNLAGHDMDSALAAFHAAADDRPTRFIAYMIKRCGLPFAGHKDNHAGLMNRKQMAHFQRNMGVAAGAVGASVRPAVGPSSAPPPRLCSSSFALRCGLCSDASIDQCMYRIKSWTAASMLILPEPSLARSWTCHQKQRALYRRPARRTGCGDHGRAGFYPHRGAAARLARESLERRQAARARYTVASRKIEAEIAAHRRKPDPITPGGVK